VRCTKPRSGELKGVTVALKDNIALAGVQCTNGRERWIGLRRWMQRLLHGFWTLVVLLRGRQHVRTIVLGP
jgi:hypothetical protein